MTWETVLDWVRWLWIAAAVPLVQWLNNKRKEYRSLVQKVEGLDNKINQVEDKLDTKVEEDRLEREARRKEDMLYREQTSDKMDKIYDIVVEVKTATAINSTKLDERK